MSLTTNDLSSFFRLALLSATVCVTAAATACAQGKTAGRSAPATAATPQTGTTAGGGVVVTVDGKTVDDLETHITLNPCKGETPGNVLGVGEQLETPRRVAAFVGKLRDPDAKARACAARQLGYMEAEARDALPHVVRRMREEEHQGVRVNLSEALWAIGPDTRATVAEWLESSRAAEPEVRFYAAFALGYYKPHPARRKEVVAALAAATRDKDPGVSWVAVRGLHRLGPDAADAVPELLVVLLDEKSGSRLHAAMALGSIGPRAEAAAPSLLKVLYTTQDFVLYTSAYFALARIGPSVVPLLAKDLKTDKTLRILDVLEHLAPHGAPLVMEALRMKDREVRLKAVKVVRGYGAAAAEAVPLLVKELKTGDKELRGEAAVSLYSLAPLAKSAVPDLTAALGDEDGLVKCYAAKTLGRMGEAGAPAVPELRRMLSLTGDGGPGLARRCAAEALMTLGPETRALVPPELAKEVEEFNKMIGDIGADYYVDETRPRPKEKKEPAPPDY